MTETMQDDPHDHSLGDVPPDAQGTGDPVQAGLEQFQRAALEAIRAGRAMLDAAEAILQEPSATDAVVRTVGSVARDATQAVAGFASGVRPSGAGAGAEATDDHDDPPDGFERISVG